MAMERDLSMLKPELRKSSAEQTLLRSIQELEAELRETQDGTRGAELSEQISFLRAQLEKLQGPDYSELERENRKLRGEAAALKARLDSGCGAAGNGAGQDSAAYGADPKEAICLAASESAKQLRSRLKLCTFLLNKYNKTINDLENKTVGEIKGMVSGDDLSVQTIVESFKQADYSFEHGYLQAARQAYDFVVKEIECVDAQIDLNFWLSPKEILSAKVGDDEDIAVLLCSMLNSLGDEDAEVVIAELEDLTTHAFVITKHNGRFMLLDATQKGDFEEYAGTRREVLSNYEFNGSRIKRFLYRFNNRNYEQFL